MIQVQYGTILEIKNRYDKKKEEIVKLQNDTENMKKQNDNLKNEIYEMKEEKKNLQKKINDVKNLFEVELTQLLTENKIIAFEKNAIIGKLHAIIYHN